MAKNLVIVESPAKAKTIEGFLGKDFTVKSSYGHIRDLEKSDMGVDVEKNFKPLYIIPPDKKKTVEYLKEAAKKFVGAIWQYPPDFSAKRVQGDRAYNIARSGGQPDVKPVLVNISKFEIVSVLLPMIEFKVVCGKGTYIRSLAHDLGRQLGCGGLLASLCRTRIGKYKLKDAKELKAWMEAVQPIEPKKRIPVRTAIKKAKERAKDRKKLAASGGTKSALRKKSPPKKKPTVKKKSKEKKKK